MNIFIAFANQDRDVRDKLLRQMNLVKDRQGWNIWSAKEIKAGERWGEEIEQRLRDSELVILLLSADFFASDYIMGKELPEVVEKHKQGNCQIIPVLARQCHWKDTPFGEYAELGDIQALPVGEKPIVSRGFWDNEDQPYFEVVEGIKESIRAFQAKKKEHLSAQRVQEAEALARADRERQEALQRAEQERLAAEAQRAKEADRNIWQQAADIHSIQAYQTYLTQFPQGEMAREARFRIKDLKRHEAAPVPFRRYATLGGGVVAVLLLVWLGAKVFGNSDGVTPSHPVTVPKKSTIDLVAIPGGTFDMGDTFGDGEKNEKPTHQVTIKSFYLEKTEVSLADFKAFIDDSGYQTDAEKGDGSFIWNGKGWAKKAGVNWRCNEEGQPRPVSEYDHPVIHVSWNDAVAYCNWLSKKDNRMPCYTIQDSTVTCDWAANGYRLPTEAEWEYAARSGGKKYKYAWGNGAINGNIADETARQKIADSDWEIEKGYNDGYVYASPVGKFSQGDLGLTDMSGNVSEWCWDWYGDYQSATQTSPKGPVLGQGRVYRGGGWGNNAVRCRVSGRYGYEATYRDYNVGFRPCSFSMQ